MSSRVVERARKMLKGGWRKARRVMRMANGALIPSQATWDGMFELETGFSVEGRFEVLPTDGGWDFLFGKPMLSAFRAVHDYADDSISIRCRRTDGSIIATTLYNSLLPPPLSHHDAPASAPEPAVAATNNPSNSDPAPSAPKPHSDQTNATTHTVPINITAYPNRRVIGAPPRIRPLYRAASAKTQIGCYRWSLTSPEGYTRRHIGIGDNIRCASDNETRTRSDAVFAVQEPNIYTRATDPFNGQRIDALLKAVRIDPDGTLSPDEFAQVRSLLIEFADCFALSLSEVCAVDGAVHRLDVPDGHEFSRKVHQKPLTPPQRAFFNKKLDEMLAAGIIEQVRPEQVKACSPVHLAQKAHDANSGLSTEELKLRVNEQCLQGGVHPFHDIPASFKPSATDAATPSEQSWRITIAFNEVNNVTKVAPMPQGDIRAKQQRLRGHQWLSVFDFASGFYACTVAEESRPYTCFYVEGRGFFWYCRMPFGLTGAPSTFAHMTATALHDLLLEAVMELFVDDGGCAADTFGDMMDKLRRVLTRVRERKLSLSATKTVLFAVRAVFAGAMVGPEGVSPDTAKLSAIVDWPIPESAAELESFVGLTGHFRDLIRDYARIEGPLRNILRRVPMPSKPSKAAYRRAMLAFDVRPHWGEAENRAFLALKCALTSEPVLRKPVFDGTPFIVTTDGCKAGFGAVLSQIFTTKLPNGRLVTKRHPIAFASKRTSQSEERYKPFLLEFAALKYGCERFSDIIWGSPVMIETDCQALRDVLCSEKLGAVHGRWLDSIIAHHIVDVRHVPGKMNVVADPLSRLLEERARKAGDGSEFSVNPDWESDAGLVNDIFVVDSDVAELRARFVTEPVFLEVVDALLELDAGEDVHKRRRARHRAVDYMIEDGRLYKMMPKPGSRARYRLECISRQEARAKAAEIHAEGGHFGRERVRLALADAYTSPRMEQSIVTAIAECAKCKNFGSTHLHSLLQPVTRRHPFELVVGDYLSMPDGKGGFHTVGLYVDVYSQHVWGFKYKTAGSAKTTSAALTTIFRDFLPADTFMSDGGKHFKNAEVRSVCEEWGTTPHVISAYSPWVNGLVEGSNKIFLHVIKRLCAPDLGEDDTKDLSKDEAAKLMKKWPDHFERTIHIMNNRLLPVFNMSPKELLFGRILGTPPTPLEESTSKLHLSDVELQVAHVAQQNLDGYSAAVTHAVKRKDAFDKRVIGSRAGAVTFKRGDLVQVYRSDLDYTFSTSRKMLPKWSAARRVVSRHVNSYRLATASGVPLEGLFSARRLRRFVPRQGTRLAAQQKKFAEQVEREEERKPVWLEAARTAAARSALSSRDEDAAHISGGHMGRGDPEGGERDGEGEDIGGEGERGKEEGEGGRVQEDGEEDREEEEMAG
ncbi:unnamed protein product, partial [Peniophora sp. CBMAI 1063]